MTKVSKDELYLALTEKYGWDPNLIADMNPYQQLVYYRGPKHGIFNTYEELMAWRRANGK